MDAQPAPAVRRKAALPLDYLLVNLAIGVAFLSLPVMEYLLSDDTATSVLAGNDLGGPSRIVRLVAMVLVAVAVVGSLFLRRVRVFRIVSLTSAALFTVVLVLNVVELLLDLRSLNDSEGSRLLLDSALVWVSNVFIFGIWYWLLDGGGPENRIRQERRHPCDFLFPQEASTIPGYETWQPASLDYLYVAFCFTTTLGPSDTIALSRRSKLLLMAQASLSLLVLTVIAARAISMIR